MEEKKTLVMVCDYNTEHFSIRDTNCPAVLPWDVSTLFTSSDPIRQHSSLILPPYQRSGVISIRPPPPCNYPNYVKGINYEAAHQQWPNNLLVVDAGVKRQAGKGGITTLAPLTVVYPFQKTSTVTEVMDVLPTEQMFLKEV